MSRTMKTILRICLIILLAFAACLIFPQKTAEAQRARKSASSGAVEKPASPRPATIQKYRNVGKAYYEQAKYPEAIAEFQKVIASGRAFATDHLNLGLALMQANELDKALGALTTAKQMEPKLVAADYNLGILYKRELRYPDAEAALKRVIEADSNEPAAWFNLGSVYFAQRKLEDALDSHRHVVDMGFGRGQNFYVASLFHSFTTLVRLKRRDEAQKFLKVHETMRDAVPGISLQNPALEGGKYGAILVPPSPTTVATRRRSQGSVDFVDITERLGLANSPAAASVSSDVRREIKSSDYSPEFSRQNLVPLFGPSLALGDVNQDGHPDLYVVNPAGANRLLQNKGDGTFTDITEKTRVAGPGASVSATFADYNNSGHASLFVVGAGGVTLYRNDGEGRFVDETEKAGLRGIPSELLSRAVLVDADNDGFLDVVLSGYTDLSKPPDKPVFSFPDDFPIAQTRLYRNNGDGTFSNVTPTSGLASARGRMRDAVFGDFDNDGYSDLLLVRDDGPPLVYLGRGECKFTDRTARAGADLKNSGAVAAQVADFNHDGNFDVALWSPQGYSVLLNRGGGRFRAARNMPAKTSPAGSFAYRGLVADVDGDTFDDLLIVDGSGKWHLVTGRAGRFREAALKLTVTAGNSLAALAPTWLSTPGKLNLIGLTDDARLAAFEKDGPPSRWLEVKMSGFKSNTLGIGSVVELKAGNFYKKVMVTGDRLRLSTGDLSKLDVVRVTWPNAVIQNWIEVATNKPIEVRESERLASSCPFLYVWDGEQFVFLTDVLGVAPTGELAPDGTRIRPYPEEFVRPPKSLRDRDGMYVFQLTDELREVDYFDQLRLYAVDHPESEEVYANEIYSSSPTSPTLHVIPHKIFPVSAVDHTGNDVLPQLLHVDSRYPTNFRRLGIPGLGEFHSLTLDLGEIPPSSPVALWLTGWVYWTDSNSHRALMSNSLFELVPPYLQVRNGQGEWVTVISDMGVPSGTNRTMRVDLTGKFLSTDRLLRIVTNSLVYWDRIFYTTDEQPAPTPTELPLVSADLHYRGFSTPISGRSHSKPEYFDYASLLTTAPWNPMVGNYTRYGGVEELVNEVDDRLVVMATGDEMTVEFDGRGLSPLKPGRKRTFFLYTHGWAKDGEPNTAYSKTVEPLPFRQMSNYPYGPEERYPETPEHRKYMRDYQTRPGYRLIPPLSPPLD
jgi:Tfp pilus assembly protein PilF